MSQKKGICPICSNKLIYQTEKEIHHELDINDPHRIEEIGFLWCEECGFKDKED